MFDLDGKPLAAITASTAWSVEREGRAGFVAAVETGEVDATRRRARFEAYVASATSKRGPLLTFDVVVRAPNDAIAWRTGS